MDVPFPESDGDVQELLLQKATPPARTGIRLFLAAGDLRESAVARPTGLVREGYGETAAECGSLSVTRSSWAVHWSLADPLFYLATRDFLLLVHRSLADPTFYSALCGLQPHFRRCAFLREGLHGLLR